MNRKNDDKLMSSAANGRLIDFDQAEIRHSQFNDELFLFVSGQPIENGWKAMLSPVIHHNKLDYLTVEVLKVRSDKQNEMDKPYRASLPLGGIAGKKGVVLIGANETQTLDIESTDI